MAKQETVAALYLRLSKEDMDKQDRGDDSESIKNQRSLLTEEALRRGFRIGEIYSDEDYSGTDSTRPAFNRLIEDAKQRKFNVILCKSQSRFTRDMELSEKYIHGLFPKLGIRFIGVVDHADTDIKGNKKARQINALINEWYVEDLSENVRAVYRSKMQQGQYLGAFALYGYRKDAADHHRLVVDEEAAENVRKIFRYCLEGYGAQNICYKLQEEGVLPPTDYKQSKGLDFHTPFQGGYAEKKHLWSPTTVKRILTNEMYMGTLVQGRERRISYKSRKQMAVPQKEWVRIENNHEPIISKEDFYQVQEILRLRRREPKAEREGGRPYPLAGKVFCRDCGSSMIRSGAKGTNGNYLRCRLAAKSRSSACTSHSIKYFALEKALLEGLQEQVDGLLQNEEERQWLCRELGAGGEESLEKYLEFPELTPALVYAFIDYVEIGEKDEKQEQEVIVHWKF